MKGFYFFCFVLSVLMISLAAIAVIKELEKEESVIQEYFGKCNALNGDTYVVERSNKDKVTLCVNTENLLLEPEVVDNKYTVDKEDKTP